jgi:hypothetical protein
MVMGPGLNGLNVEVRSRFDGRWVGGFDVEEVADDQVWVRRRSDGIRLPVPFGRADVRSAAIDLTEPFPGLKVSSVG